MRAFRRLCTYRGDSRFSTWLYVLTRNHCLNALKKRHTEPVEDGEMMPDNLPGANGQGKFIWQWSGINLLSVNMWRLITGDPDARRKSVSWRFITVTGCPLR